MCRKMEQQNTKASLYVIYTQSSKRTREREKKYTYTVYTVHTIYNARNISGNEKCCCWIFFYFLHSVCTVHSFRRVFFVCARERKLERGGEGLLFLFVYSRIWKIYTNIYGTICAQTISRIFSELVEKRWFELEVVYFAWLLLLLLSLWVFFSVDIFRNGSSAR